MAKISNVFSKEEVKKSVLVMWILSKREEKE